MTAEALRVIGPHLRRAGEKSAEIAALHAEAGGPVGLADVLDDLDQRGHSARVPGRAVSHGFGWEVADALSLRWWPQGVTTSADAGPTEAVAGRSVLLVSWYARRFRGWTPGSRLTVVDLATLRYRHVLLARPVLRDGRVDLEPLNAHVGGLAWCGPHLLMAGTGRGLYTARLDDLVRLGSHGGRVGRGPDGLLAGGGYRYVLPVRSAYRARGEDGVPGLRYSFLSVDRIADQPQLVVGEYGRGRQTTRLARFAVDFELGRLVDGDDGSARPLAIEDHGEGRMQGAAVVGDTWYLTSSRAQLARSSMYVGRPGAFVEHRHALPMGCEDLAYWPSRDEFWSLAEHPGRRWVFAVPRSRVAVHRAR